MRAVSGSYCLGLACAVVFVGSLNATYHTCWRFSATPGSRFAPEIRPESRRSTSSLQPPPTETATETRRETLEDIIARCERDYGVDRFLITAVIKVESNFNPGAVSSEGAQGLMQLMPDMAQEVGITDRLDPVQNVTGGTIYLARQLRDFQGDLPLALAAYNAGPSAVRKHGGIPPYQVTRNFVDKVIYYQRHFQRGANAIPGITE